MVEQQGADSDQLEAHDLLGYDPSGYDIIELPPSLLGIDQRRLWERLRVLRAFGIEPTTPVEHLLLDTLHDVRARRLKVSVPAFLTGVAMAVAHVSRCKLPTHSDGIARHLGIRKATLLAVRRLAIARARALRLSFAEE